MRKLIIGLASAAALAVTALPAMAQHHHHHFFRGGFGFSPWLFALPLATPLLSPYGYGAGCGAAYGGVGAYGAYGAVQPPCVQQGLYAYPYPYGFVGPGVRRFHHPHAVTPSPNTK